MDFLSGAATDYLQLSSSTLTPLLNADNASEPIGDGNLSGVSMMITVNSTADVVDSSNGVTTLREAINFANADTTDDAIAVYWKLIPQPISVVNPTVSLINGSLVNVSAADGSSITANASNLNITGGSQLNADIGPRFGSVEAKLRIPNVTLMYKNPSI